TRLDALLQPEPGGRYLDVGCGTGNYTVSLAARGLPIVGVDQSTTMLRAAQAKDPRVAWRRGDVVALPFRNGAFRGAVCTLAIHHFLDLRAAFAEVSRVLARGRFVIFTAMPEQMGRYWLGAYFPRMLERSVDQMPGLTTVETALAEAGLQLVGVEPWDVPPDLTDRFFYAGKHRPELYLDPEVRRGISSFRKLVDAGELEAGLARLRADIRTGQIMDVIAAHAHPGGDYSFVVAEKTAVG
ncbi:MAG: class I SAM-dependent methyltransferase, partial [Chloroflexi bacterium]|nr:class I SAM-dependent methyltransferase [Chloroflexota bacterium]